MQNSKTAMIQCGGHVSSLMNGVSKHVFLKKKVLFHSHRPNTENQVQKPMCSKTKPSLSKFVTIPNCQPRNPLQGSQKLWWQNFFLLHRALPCLSFFVLQCKNQGRPDRKLPPNTGGCSLGTVFGNGESPLRWQRSVRTGDGVFIGHSERVPGTGHFALAKAMMQVARKKPTPHPSPQNRKGPHPPALHHQPGAIHGELPQEAGVQLHLSRRHQPVRRHATAQQARGLRS